jgi:uncharacterized protein YdhG (YjbR/CyaY superfamily)
MADGSLTMTPTTVGAYLRDLPPDRRVAMARVCSMIRRSARGVRESMRYGLAFYELDGPLFALESGRRHMSLFVAEQEVVARHKSVLQGVDARRSFVRFSDLNRLPLDVVEKIVRDSVAARRTRVAQGTVPTQAELLRLWDIKEEKAAPPPGKQVISLKPTAAELAAQAAAMAASGSMAAAAAATTKMVSAIVRHATQAAIPLAAGKNGAATRTVPAKQTAANKQAAAKKSAAKPARKSAAAGSSKSLAKSSIQPLVKSPAKPIKTTTRPTAKVAGAAKKPATAKKAAKAVAKKAVVKKVLQKPVARKAARRPAAKPAARKIAKKPAAKPAARRR